MQMFKISLYVGSLFAAIAIIAGALEAHALQSLLASQQGTENFHKARDYLAYHALGLVMLSTLIKQQPQCHFEQIAWVWIVGCVLFSGSLFVYSLTGWKTITSATPIGGSILILSWLWLGFKARKMT